MKVSILIIVSFFTCAVSVNAAYDHIIEEGYSAGLSLDDYETLLMTGGGLNGLSLFDWSSATIEGTDPLVEFSGGIWLLSVGGYSQLDFSGGEVREIGIYSDSYATLSGGSIDEIRNYQFTDPAKNIEIVCRDWQYNTNTKILTGTWQDFTTFDIQLVNVTGREPTIDNILFTPEPATLALFALGATLIRKRS